MNTGTLLTGVPASTINRLYDKAHCSFSLYENLSDGYYSARSDFDILFVIFDLAVKNASESHSDIVNPS